MEDDGTSTLDSDWVADGEVSSPSVAHNDLSSESSPPVELDLKDRSWTKLLGVQTKTDPLASFDQLYNLRTQSEIRKLCRELAKKVDNRKSVPELESLLTFYCKKRGVEYSAEVGWMAVLEKLLRFEIEDDALFNIFFAITTKYIPRDTRPSSQVFDLLRLLLQYHDPMLSSHIDSLKIPTSTYASSWFSSLLAADTDEKACHALWDLYFRRGDPFLIFFMAIVLVVNARDTILATGIAEKAKALEILRALPENLSVDDVPDFVDLAAYYSNRTPQCVREDFHCMMFGSNLIDDFSEVPINKILCLPISIQEIYRKDKGSTSAQEPISYFVIDCRPQDHFKAGNIKGSYNLDCQLFVDTPEAFEIALKGLQSIKTERRPDDHLCFLGSGREEHDAYMTMVIARFLMHNKEHISFADGGYRTLHHTLSETKMLRRIADHDAKKCIECGEGSKENGTSKAWSLVGKMKAAVSSSRAAVKEAVSGLVSTADSSPSFSYPSPTDRHQTKYKGEKSTAGKDFTIGSDDSGDEPFGSPEEGKSKLNLSVFLKQADIIESFEGSEMMWKEGRLVDCHVALTRTHMHILHHVDNPKGHAVVSARHPLASIVRVTSKRKVPELLTFKFGYELSPGKASITAQHRFIIPKAGDLAKAVKTAIFALRPKSDDEDSEHELPTR